MIQLNCYSLSPAATRVLACAALVAGAVSAADAQDALGSGSALDANPLVGSGGRNLANPRAAFERELQLRNAIVTGNVPDGRSFRGNVGYTAANDFRGALGSNDLFDFNRDSLYSTLATRDVRGIQALRFGLGQSIANQTNPFGGGLIISRSQSGAAARQELSPGTTAIKVDPYGHLQGAMRSTTDFYLADNRLPRVLDSFTGRDGMPTYLTSTGLLGVKPVRAANTLFDISVLSVERRPGGALDERPGPLDERDQGNDIRTPGLSNRVSNQIDPVSMHDQLIESIRQGSRVSDELRMTGRASLKSDSSTPPLEDDDAPGALPRAASQPIPLTPSNPDADSADDDADAQRQELNEAFRLDLERLRHRLQRDRRPSDIMGRPELGDVDDEDRGDRDADDSEDQEKPSKLLEEARALLGGAQRLETLIAEAGVEDIYGLHMRRGQELLAEDRWFDAEERFSAALRARPGDPMAAAGRVSAQVGAGMIRSASLNLRNLFTAYPEMIQVRLDAGLFPRDSRLAQVLSQLRYRAERDTDIARHAAFVLAYVGFQSESARDIALGFESMEQIDRDEAERTQTPVPEPSELERLLKELWLEP